MNRNRSSNPVYSKMIKCSFFRIIVLLPTRVAPITKKKHFARSSPDPHSHHPIASHSVISAPAAAPRVEMNHLYLSIVFDTVLLGVYACSTTQSGMMITPPSAPMPGYLRYLGGQLSSTTDRLLAVLHVFEATYASTCVCLD